MGYTMAEKILMKNTGLSHLAPGDLIMTRPDMYMISTPLLWCRSWMR